MTQIKNKNEKPWTISLHKTVGKRKVGSQAKSNFKQHCLVLYFAPESWPSRSMELNGNGYKTKLCSAPSTPEARAYTEGIYRARNLSYNGLGKQNAQGLAADLERLGFDQDTRNCFLEAAKPYWPIEIKSG